MRGFEQGQEGVDHAEGQVGGLMACGEGRAGVGAGVGAESFCGAAFGEEGCGGHVEEIV